MYALQTGIDSYTVTFTKADVTEFKRQWPCSGLPDARLLFEFSADGDLIDAPNLANADQSAVAALVADARKQIKAQFTSALPGYKF